MTIFVGVRQQAQRLFAATIFLAEAGRFRVFNTGGSGFV
jgi:pseudouridine-5'-phosphate glycosidase